MVLDLDPDALRRFSDKYCGGREPDIEMLRDMAAALGLRLGIKLVEKE